MFGGSRGIGAAIVRLLAAEGAAVTFTYAGSHQAAEELASETGSTAVVTDSADCDAVIARIRQSGALDIPVVNAGFALFGDALDLDPGRRRPAVPRQYPRPLSCVGRSGAPHASGRADHHNWLGKWRPGADCWHGFVCAEQVGPAGAGTRARARFRTGASWPTWSTGPIDTDANPEDGPTRT